MVKDIVKISLLRKLNLREIFASQNFAEHRVSDVTNPVPYEIIPRRKSCSNSKLNLVLLKNKVYPVLFERVPRRAPSTGCHAGTPLAADLRRLASNPCRRTHFASRALNRLTEALETKCKICPPRHIFLDGFSPADYLVKMLYGRGAASAE